MNKIFRVVWNQATQSWVAVSELTKAHKKQSSSNSLKAVVGTAAVLLSINTAQAAVAIGETTANNTFNQSPAQATGTDAVAIGNGSNANQTRAIAIGKGATISSGQDTIAIGTETKAQGHTSIVIGKNAKTTQGAEGTVVIGRDAFSEGSGKVERANTVVGRGAYTAFGQNGEYRLNAATALGLQAGAGVIVDPANNRKLVNNNTNADNNAEVLVKAGYGLDANAPADTKAALQGGNVNNNLTFYRKNHINEATAIGVEARAIGDQSIAIGGQVVAGDGVVALGGNDTDQLRNNKYQVVTDDAVNKTKVETIDDYNLAYTESTNTVEGQYKKLVGRGMPTAYKSTYGQSGSVVIGMETHSTTALGTAIGTNSVVRMGAFGATAIGAGSTVQPNAEAAVAIGMGSVANGAYALAGGTASWADYGDIALGYQAKATGKDGAIAMGRATNAQGDSSIMIGGANIASAAAQNTSYEKANGQTIDKTVTEKINGQNVTRKYSFAGTTPATGTVAEAYKELTGITMDTAALDFAKNKNGHASTSLGVHALSKGDLGTAIGAGSRSDAIGSVALGTGAHATRQNAVAIGTGSTTDLVGTRQLSVNYDSDGNIVSDNSDKIAYTFKWAGGINTSEGDVVSFGSSGAERQLKNVAAGRVAEDSTDAINGSQLNSITKKIAVGFNTSGNVVDGSSGEFTSKQKNANVDSTKKDYETAIRSLDKIQLQVGNNLKLDRNETESEIDDPDSPDKNNPLKKKIKKADFAYSLNPILTNLTSAEFKGTDANAPTTMLTNAGVTITPEASTRKKPVSLTENGLDNGGNPITNVAGNLEGAKANTTAPTNEAAKPDNADTIKNNAATVGDVLNAGWNLQEKGAAKDFVTAYDTVNFIDGNGTTVSVENTDNKTSTIKYSANLGDGLEKTNDNKIKVKAADKSLEVTNEGVKVKAADNTLTTDANGLKVNTGNITTAAVPTVTAGDENKIATVGNVADAIKAAAWNATSAATTSGENTGMKVQPVKAGDTVTFEADKNIKIAQTDGKFTFSTKDNVEFTTVKVGDTTNGKKPVELKNGDVINANNNPEQPATALNVSSDGKPTQITGVGSVLNTDAVPTIPAGTATTGNDQPKLVNLGTGHNQTALGNNVLNAAATVRDLANMGWVVSSDKATDGAGEYKDVVKNANEVKFVGKNAAKVSGKTDPTTGIRTITVDVEVPSVETAKITQNTDGSVTGPAGETLTKALKDAKDELAKLPKDADPAKVQAAKDKVDAAQKAIDDSPNSNKVATAQNVADMINNSGFTLKTSKVEGGEKDATSTGDEVINPGKAVEMIAGKNLTVKQEANGKVTYSTKDEVSFNTVQVGGSDGPKLTKTESGDLKLSDKDDAKPVAITNVKSNLPETKNGIPAEVTKAQPAPEANQVNASNAATVGDVLNAGWNLQNNGEARDFVKPYDTVNFVDGLNTKAVVTTDAEGKVSNVQIDVKDLPIAYTNEAGDKVVKAADGKYYKESDLAGKVYDPKTKQFKNADGTALDEQPTEVAGDTVKTNLVNPNAEANKAGDATQLGNVASGANTFAPVEGKKLGNDGKWYNAADVLPNGQPKENVQPVAKPENVGKAGLIDFSNSNPNNAATVGDLQNLGWVVSAEGNNYSDQVRNTNEVKFVGEGTATVTGETDANGVRTITVSVDDQVSTNNAQTPVNYTTADGTKVYPLKDEKGNVTYHTTPDGMGEGDKEIAPENVITSLNGPKGTKAPTTLSNVAGNLDGAKKDTQAPTTEHGPVNTTDAAAPNYVNPNNAATVGDVLNAGWNLQNNGEARDFVKPYDTVNFVNGIGTVAVVKTNDAASTSDVTFNVDMAEITPESDGSVKGPVSQELLDALDAAQAKVDENPDDEEAKKALEAAVDAVNKAGGHKVANAQNVADMINSSGFTLKTSEVDGGKKVAGTKDDGELINPGKTVEMVAGKNMSVKQDDNGKVTYATKDNVEFNTVKVGGDANTYVDDKGNPVTKKEDGSFEDAEGNKVAKDKVSPVAPVTLKTEKASLANNNAEGNHPTTALNVSSDGKPTQLTGVGSVLNTTAVPTTPEGTLNGKAPTEAAKQPKLVNLTNEDGSPLDDAILNSAATVRDIANMGWVVSTKDSNGYKDVVKNANQVDFVGKNGITVTGETKDGIRTITVETAQSPVVYTDKEGNKLVKAGDNFYPADSVVFGDKAYPADSVVIDGNVYPAGTTADDVKAGTATPATALANGKKPADVIASMNNGDDKSANAPMQLGNVAQGAETIAPVDADGNKLVKANDGKYYPEGKVKADGSLEDGTTDADVKQPLKLANDGKWYPADQISAKGVPTDTAKAVTPPAKMDPAAGLVDFANSNPNNAATVGDLQNMGWIVGAPANGYTDQVRNANKVNFVGKGIATVTGETDAEGVRTITVNVANGLVDVAKNAGTATGAVTGPKKAAEDALKAAQEELANATDDAAKKAAQDKIDAAQNALNNAGNLVATAQNVADMINQSGWNATSAATTGGEVSGTTKELINPSETVTFEAGKNISITQAENKFTFATKDDVEFNTVKIANPNGATYTDKNNNPLVKADDDKFYPADQVENGKVKDPATATPVEADKVTTKAAPSVEFKAENATLATNNTGKDKDGKTVEPTTALNISSDDGKPTQLKGVGSVLNTADVNTSTGEQRDTDGNITPAQAGTDKLVDLGTNPKKGDKPLSEETLNSAATVRDLANMGWVVSAKDNNYTNTVKNANKVEFKGKNGISVTGKDVTQQDGTVTREITVAIAEGSVTDKVTITTKDGKEIPAIKIGDNYYSVDKDGKPVGYEVDANGKPTANNRPLDVTDAEIKNNGAGFVTGNSVATAIQESGWNVGLANTADADKAFNDADKALSATKLEKVNPNDNVRFADGKGTKAAVATVERVDEFGKKVTDTYVKFDVDAGKVEAVKDAAGNNTGAVTGPVTTALNDALTKAQEAQKALKPDATKAEKDAAQAAVDAAQAAVNNAGNQVATAQNVAEAINNSGWRTNSTTATGGAKDTLINPGKAVNFEAGKNMEVAQTVDKDGNVAYTYKTKDDVQFNSVQFGDTNGPKITNNGGNINVSGPDGKAPTKITGVAAGDISPNSTDAVNGAQIYALSRGNVPNVKNITDAAGNTYNNVIVDEKGTPILKTYNVQGQKEIITNSVVEAIYNMNEQGIKFFHSNDGVDRPKVETENSFDSSASGKFATAIGSKSSAEGTNAVAIGFNSVVTGNDSISIGTGNRVTGNNSGAFGDPSTVSGQRSYSVGNNNTVVTNDTFVLGNEVTQTVENSVILGKKSTATAGDGSATGTLNNIKQDGTKGTSTTAGSKGTVKQAIVGNMVYGGFEGATADGVVSVGAAGNERRIQNVAAGEISATSTDAINGSQLYSVAQGVGNRLGDLNNKINRNNKNLRAGIAGANAAAGLPQVYIPGKSMVAASAGTYKGQSALAVGYSRASDNGKLILKLQGNANTRGDVGGSVGVGYQW